MTNGDGNFPAAPLLHGGSKRGKAWATRERWRKRERGRRRGRGREADAEAEGRRGELGAAGWLGAREVRCGAGPSAPRGGDGVTDARCGAKGMGRAPRWNRSSSSSCSSCGSCSSGRSSRTSCCGRGQRGSRPPQDLAPGLRQRCSASSGLVFWSPICLQACRRSSRFPRRLATHCTALLAALAFIGLRRGWRAARGLAWACTIVGTLDLLVAFPHAAATGAISHMAAQWYVPVFAGPLLVVCHFACFLLLVRGSGSS